MLHADVQSKDLESDFELLMAQRQADMSELARLRDQARDYSDLLEENVVMRQKMGRLERELAETRAAAGSTEMPSAALTAAGFGDEPRGAAEHSRVEA